MSVIKKDAKLENVRKIEGVHGNICKNSKIVYF